VEEKTRLGEKTERGLAAVWLAFASRGKRHIERSGGKGRLQGRDRATELADIVPMERNEHCQVKEDQQLTVVPGQDKGGNMDRNIGGKQEGRRKTAPGLAI